MVILKKTYLPIVFMIVLAMGSGIVAAAPNGTELVREVKLTSDGLAEGDEFGRSVAINGDNAAVGASSDGSKGAVYLYKLRGQTYIEETKLTAPDSQGLGEFGRCVAFQGNQLFIGARFAKVGELDRAGAVYVYRKYQGSWHFEQKIISPNPENEDNFGRALAVQGGFLVVTARKENQNASDVGAAYTYAFKGGAWLYQAKITANDPQPGAYFGQSVALNGDLMAVGARNANTTDGKSAGAVYVFRRSGNEWSQIARVSPAGGKNNDQYGFTVAISGNVLVVGARRTDTGTLADTGAAYVYSIRGDSVDLVTKLTASDKRESDELGQSVAFIEDAIAVGAWKYDIGDWNKDTGYGAIYLFRQINNQWTETGKITAFDGSSGDEFGYSLAAFGNHMVTGAHKDDLNGVIDAGSAYIIELKPPTKD